MQWIETQTELHWVYATLSPRSPEAVSSKENGPIFQVLWKILPSMFPNLYEGLAHILFNFALKTGGNFQRFGLRNAGRAP